MKSVQAKAALYLIVIVIVITVANFLSSFLFTQRNLLETIEKELVLARNIADDLVSTRISLLESDAHTVAERVAAADDDDLVKIMREQLNIFRGFMSFTVFDRDGVVASFGYVPAPPELLQNSKYIKNAFAGINTISTTYYDAEAKELVMYICVPVNKERVLSVTMSGTFFSRLLSRYRLWETGNIFLIDEEGTMIASYRDDFVQGRINFINLVGTNPRDDDIAGVYKNMISSYEGIERYHLNGIERLCSYKHVSNSTSGWVLGVVAPLPESPAANVQNELLMSSLLFLGVGVIVAGFLSGFIAKPFYQIEEQKLRLEEMNETVKAASEAKTNFLANMSHEMRTPLNAIIGLSELSLGLESGGDKNEINTNLKKIYNSGMILLSTVNDILDISKIEAGKSELIPDKYFMASLINDTISQNILRIGEKPIKFILNIDENLPLMLMGDELRIRQILSNLISNAIKYTKEGTVELSLSCERDGVYMWMNAIVKDTGIGIRTDDMAKIFSSYNQVDIKANRAIEGTGLGLVITKKLLEMMDGTIDVKSEYGKGSVFSVRFRQGYVSDECLGKSAAEGLKKFEYIEQKQQENAGLVRISMPYARVLVVDDVATNLDVTKGMMKPYGMQIDCISSGEEAIQLVRSGVKYNAIFMDHMMPGMDGIEATRIIREKIDTNYARNVPIIALTANVIMGNEKIFLENGFQGFISKPIDLKKLDSVLRQWVRDKKLERDLSVLDSKKESNAAKTDTGKESPAQSSGAKDRREAPALRVFDSVYVDGVNMKKLQENFQNDDYLFEVLQSFVTTTPVLLSQMKEPNRENLAAYAVKVHGIKGSSRGICAEAIGNSAEALEKAALAEDLDFVTGNNAVFHGEIALLIKDISQVLEKIAEKKNKPLKEAPDSAVLKKLIEASENYDMDGVDMALSELEKYDYQRDQDLVKWLREQAESPEFKNISEKLESIIRQD